VHELPLARREAGRRPAVRIGAEGRDDAVPGVIVRVGLVEPPGERAHDLADLDAHVLEPGPGRHGDEPVGTQHRRVRRVVPEGQVRALSDARRHAERDKGFTEFQQKAFERPEPFMAQSRFEPFVQQELQRMQTLGKQYGVYKGN
jgi:hypothetical protein